MQWASLRIWIPKSCLAFWTRVADLIGAEPDSDHAGAGVLRVLNAEKVLTVCKIVSWSLDSALAGSKVPQTGKTSILLALEVLWKTNWEIFLLVSYYQEQPSGGHGYSQLLNHTRGEEDKDWEIELVKMGMEKLQFENGRLWSRIGEGRCQWWWSIEAVCIYKIWYDWNSTNE